MTDEYEEVTSVTVDESMIRKIGDNQYLKIIPSQGKSEISTIIQEKITQPIEQTDEIIIKACPTKVRMFRNSKQDLKYETEWKTIDGSKINIPSTNIKTIYSLLQAKGLIVVDNMLNLSNILSMIIKQDTLEKKLEEIKEDMK
ncbi:MAG: hypothetical protein LUG89_06205 [Methanosphaera sp.]|nr:hypothetical protein [Methanosphaera sp.]